MKKPARYILYGVVTCVCVYLIMALIRTLIKGVPFVDGLKDLTNIFIAVLCGGSSAYTARKNDLEKEQREKENQDK